MWQTEICYTKQVLVAVLTPRALPRWSPAQDWVQGAKQRFCSERRSCAGAGLVEGAGVCGSCLMVSFSSSNWLIKFGLSQINPNWGSGSPISLCFQVLRVWQQGQSWLQCHLGSARMSPEVNHCLRVAQEPGNALRETGQLELFL